MKRVRRKERSTSHFLGFEMTEQFCVLIAITVFEVGIAMWCDDGADRQKLDVENLSSGLGLNARTYGLLI